MIAENEYRLWIVVPFKHEETQVSNALINAGYMIGPLSNNPRKAMAHGFDNDAAFTLGYIIKSTDSTLTFTNNTLYADLQKLFKETDITYLSMIICNGKGSEWGSSTIKLKDEQLSEHPYR